jgi:hypothetical protein
MQALGIQFLQEAVPRQLKFSKTGPAKRHARPRTASHFSMIGFKFLMQRAISA